MRSIAYPFVPKSAVTLLPGQFWGVPLANGSFACGRVIQPAANHEGASRVIFYGTLLDWLGNQQPTPDSIAGAKCLAQGKIHIKSIKAFGTPILGIRPLALDNITPTLVISGLGDPSIGDWVMQGHELLRKARLQDVDLPQQQLWGAAYIRELAENKLLGAKRG